MERASDLPSLLDVPAPTDLAALLQLRAERTPDRLAFRFLYGGGEDGVEEWSYAELHRRAAAVASGLQARRLRGERALLLFPPGLDFVAAFFGCCYAGVVAVPAYPPEPARVEATLPRLQLIARDARPAVILAHPMIAGLAEGLAEQAPELAVLEMIEVGAPEPGATEAWRREAPGELAFLQYTSGSTGTPKGVRCLHRNILANLAAMQEGFGGTSADAGVSWLPTFHDMGLIGHVLEPVWLGVENTLMSPLDFLRRPMRWLEAVSRYGGTISGGPDFAYALCAKRATEAEIAALDLRRWRVAYSGAEPVRAATLAAFAARFAPAGFDPACFYPTYGMAEATLMISRPRPGRGAALLRLDAARLERGEAAEVDGGADPAGLRVAVGCGEAAAGLEVRIAGEGGASLPEGRVGEILARGTSVADGYWDRPAESAAAFGGVVDGEGGWLRTGDLGFLRGGAVFVTGRVKDVIIVRGRNLYPQDIEQCVERAHPAIRPGCVAAFSLEGGAEEGGAEGVGVMAEVGGAVDADEVERAARAAVREAFGVALHGLALLEARQIPKTSSGKIQRQAARRAWLEGSIRPVARRGAPPANPAGLPDWLAAWLRDEARVAPERLSREATFAELGMDSVTAVQLAGVMEERLGVEVPLEVFLGRTLGDVAAWIGSGEGLAGLVQRRDLDAVRLSADITVADITVADITVADTAGADAAGAARGDIVLTGATGFVGLHLLAGLVRRGARVICLVRAPDAAAGRARLEARGARLGIAPGPWIDAGVVEVVPGDLERPGLGLAAADRARLVARAGRVLHCGAVVDWGMPYDQLAAANVAGTEEAIRLAAEAGAEFHHVSSIGVYPFGMSHRAWFEERGPLTEGHMLRLGYFQTKYAAEKLVEQARARGLRAAIYRPAYVGGHSQTGVELEPEQQLLCAFLRGSLALGQVPAVEKVIDAVPVDYVAEAIAALCLDPASVAGGGQDVNLCNPRPMSQGAMYRRLRQRGYALGSAAFPRWRERVLALPKEDPANPLARFAGYYRVVTPQLMRRLEGLMATRSSAEAEQAARLLAPHGVTCPAFDEAQLDRWIDGWVAAGQLPAPARATAVAVEAPVLLSVDAMSRPWAAGLSAEEERLMRLYARAKDRQWDASKRLDWSLEIDPENPEALPDAHVPIAGSPIWARLERSERVQLKRSYQGWQLSQFFAGEQGALLCAGRIMAQTPDATARMYAATQVVDEARHLEVFGRLLHEKVGEVFPVSGPLSRLLDDILSDRRWDVTCLGMQVLIEGLGLAAFSLVRDHTQHPLIAAAHAYVCEDEARHVSFGKLLLSDLYPRLSDAERAEREEFVIEASYLLRDRFSGREVWERAGLPVEACLRWVEEAGHMGNYRAELFRRIVPVVRSIGLWGPKVREAYRRMGVLPWAEVDVDRLIAEDERVAERLRSPVSA